MKKTVLLTFCATMIVCSSTFAVTTVNLGTLGHFSGPGDLDLSGNIVKAVNFNGPDTVVGGVTFANDAGDADLVGPQNVVGWQNRPEYGGTADDDNLEAIMHDIRWANSGAGEFLEAHIPVTAGLEYKLQLLISGNHQENRVWDIEVEGTLAVESMTSLGFDTDTYDQGTSVVYTLQGLAPDDTLDVVMGNVSGTVVGADLNPIWQGLTLEEIPEPSSGLLMLLGAAGLFLRRRNR